MKKNPEIKLLMKILAIIGFVVLFLLLAGYIFIRVQTPQLLDFSKGITEYRISVRLDSLKDAEFITGMHGCENICLEEGTGNFYVTCLDGSINLLGTDPAGHRVILKSLKAGNAVTGIALTKDGRLITGICNYSLKEWRTKGSAIFLVSKDLVKLERITGDFPSLNGICVDGKGNLYFASSNFNIFHPEGAIYRMLYKEESLFQAPEPFIRNTGMSNGLFYDESQDKIFFSNTLGGIYEFSPEVNILGEVYLKLRFMEACDDLCTDIGGNIWMTDPGNSTVKMYNPGTNRLTRFVIEGIGQASSCRIRSEQGLEMLYITELKTSSQPVSENFDGRGVLVVPAQTLIKLMESLSIN